MAPGLQTRRSPFLRFGFGYDFRRSLDAQLVHAGAQRARAQAQDLRGAGRPFDAPSGALKDLADVIAFDVDERSEPAALSRHFLDVQRLADEPREIERAFARDHEGALNHVLQLTDVARPVVALEGLEGAGRDALDRLFQLPAEPIAQDDERAAGRSSRRSRSAGMVMGKTLRR